MPTIIFDEIDTGISGDIAMKMAVMMRQMASNHQVVTITHLPQIAAAGQAHFFVYKNTEEDRAHSGIRLLTKEERIGEIAQMISGKTVTDSSKQSAKELLEIGI